MPASEVATRDPQTRRRAGRPKNPTTPLREACAGLAINPVELAKALDPDERREALDGETAIPVLRAFAVALLDRRARERGQRPDGYTTSAVCAGCGPVWLPVGSAHHVASCPWCANRAAGRSIPRPSAVHCDGCGSFERIEHPHLGRCGRETGTRAPELLWDGDLRGCGWWTPGDD